MTSVISALCSWTRRDFIFKSAPLFRVVSYFKIYEFAEAAVTKKYQWMAETTDIYCPTGLEVRGLGSRCHPGWFLLRVEGESASRLSSSFCWFAGKLWNLGLVEASLQSLLSWSHTILLVFVSVFNIPLFIMTPVILGKGAVLPQDDLILTVPSVALFS